MGHRMDKLPSENLYSSRTVQSYISTIGKLEPDIQFQQINLVKGKRIVIKFDEMSVNFIGHIYRRHSGITGSVTPYTCDDGSAPAQYSLQFVVTDIDSGHSFIGPYFFVNTLSSSQLESILTRVTLAYSQVSQVFILYFSIYMFYSNFECLFTSFNLKIRLLQSLVMV